ncbi:hypothetical protein E1262_22470 [Jiangella aurantiaca]|uniref:DNA-binding protein n=1 Tax=Jiangella aurantiaca TaxID=2530373 RepID=A0A4R5A6E2_9ACTN|nr:hypothetical protein [Jiangella aurantiaca]TDD66369.1 hypothetical protein E1262_22470 [Jiangella aurantiaca]
MPFVLTVDQRGSRRSRDLVEDALSTLKQLVHEPLLPFERTAGDEFQGVLAEPEAAVEAARLLLRVDAWSIGIGAGPVEEPLPNSTRSARGPAFIHAREALDAAKQRPQHVAVAGPDAGRAQEADAVLTLIAAVVARRSTAGWAAIDLVEAGHTFAEAADILGVTRQAVGQRLAVALWQQERDARPVVARLLQEAA